MSTGARREGGERVGAGLGRWFDPDPSLAVLAEPGGLAWPAGQLGQQASWAKRAFGHLISNKISNSNVISFLKFKSNSKILITLLKHFLIL
jgi:hypothetical protein